MRAATVLVGAVLGAVTGIIAMSIVIAVQSGVCGVPLLRMSHCGGLGPPAGWEQILMYGFGIIGGGAMGMDVAGDLHDRR